MRFGVVRRLNAKGKLATVDVLGEEITSADEARAIAGQYHDVLARIDDEGLDANVSVKLTGFGLELDLELCREDLEAVVTDAPRAANFVRIDMEDSSTTDRTLELYRELRAQGHENVGVVLQAYLRRTQRRSRGPRQRPPLQGHLRRARGARVPGRTRRCARTTFAASSCCSTQGVLRRDRHPRRVSDRGGAAHRRGGFRRERYEFQMLLGVRSDRADELVAAGHRLRVYVPYGTHWYEYSVRRLQENPKLAGYVAADLFGRVFRH